MNMSEWAVSLPDYFNSTLYFIRRLYLQLEPLSLLVKIEKNFK